MLRKATAGITDTQRMDARCVTLMLLGMEAPSHWVCDSSSASESRSVNGHSLTLQPKVVGAGRATAD